MYVLISICISQYKRSGPISSNTKKCKQNKKGYPQPDSDIFGGLIRQQMKAILFTSLLGDCVVCLLCLDLIIVIPNFNGSKIKLMAWDEQFF